MANIQKRTDKSGKVISYSVRVHRGRDLNGKQLKPYTATFKPAPQMTEKQIEKALNKFVVEFEEQCRSGRASASNIRLADFCGKYLEIIKGKLAPSTYEMYEAYITKHIIPALGHLKVKDIRPAHIQDFVSALSSRPKKERSGEDSGERLSSSTVRRYLTVLQSIFKQAMKLQLITTNPASTEFLTLPKSVAPKVEIFTKQEAAKILECLEKEELQFQVLIQLAIMTGARRGELVALKFTDFDFINKKMTIERAAMKLKGQKTQIKPPKDYEIREVALNDYCLTLVEMLKKEKNKERERLGSAWHEGGWLFTQWNGEIMNVQTPTKQFSKFLEKNGLPHRKFHALRHTSATLLLYGGVNIKQVQSRLGHSDIETTNKYLHCIEEADIEATNTLSILLNQRGTKERLMQN
ncbi:MAG: tyrosine-type recombinase/integrase [Oscillospiraceae bacterium]